MDQRRFDLYLRVPVLVKPLVCVPGSRHIDGEGTLLYAPDVLRGMAALPWDLKTWFKKRGRNGRPQNCREVPDLLSQCIQHRNDLSRMAESMAGDGAPDQRHGKKKEKMKKVKVQNRTWEI